MIKFRFLTTLQGPSFLPLFHVQTHFSEREQNTVPVEPAFLDHQVQLLSRYVCHGAAAGQSFLLRFSSLWSWTKSEMVWIFKRKYFSAPIASNGILTYGLADHSSVKKISQRTSRDLYVMKASDFYRLALLLTVIRLVSQAPIFFIDPASC